MDRFYLFDCSCIDDAYKILLIKLGKQEMLKIDFDGNKIIIQPNYRYCLPIFAINTVGFIGRFDKFEGKICLKGMYNYNKIPFIIIAVELIPFVVVLSISYFIGKNNNIGYFILLISFLFGVFIIGLYLTYRFDLKNLQKCMKKLNTYLVK